MDLSDYTMDNIAVHGHSSIKMQGDVHDLQ